MTIAGQSSQYVRTADSGSRLTFNFCPLCGATVHYTNDAILGFVGIPVGAFADASFQAPAFSVYEGSMHSWVDVPDGAERST